MVKRAAACLIMIAMAACGAPTLKFDDETSASGSGGGGGPSDASMGGSSGDGSPGDGRGNRDRPDIDTGAPVSCMNQVLDGDESDVDCGGAACAHCTTGATCRQDSDCVGAYCKLGVCAQGSCIDNVKNLKETDVDCGGGDCPPCGLGSKCISYTDCAEQSCVLGKCQSVTCDDHILGPGETDVDCGGPSCAPCAPERRCLLARDCSSGVCASQVCSAPICSDGLLNGNETGQDCGGTCAPCADGMGCMASSDCESGVCATRTCQPPSCSDRVKNQGETDVDCAGPCPKCGAGAICGQDADCASANCVGTCQPCPKDMVNVPTTSGGSYCVDATEVTIAAYNTFLTSNPPISLMPSSCATKTSYAPSVALDLTKPNYPATYVDWCDGYAYCAYLGRHLCGRIGGGTLASTEPVDASKSEWHNACTKGGTQAYPYGNVYALGACIDRQYNAVRAVGSATECVGGYPGLRDMSGNVQEWEDNCTTAAGMQPGLQDNCKTRGGAYNDIQTNLTCGTMSSTRKRNQTDAVTGFRCCL